MGDSLSTLINVTNLLLKKLAGNAGCDLISDTNPHTSRKGKITSLIVNTDATRIESITELINGLEVTCISRSYIGAVDLNQNTLIVFDSPVVNIKLSAGSVWVYYTDI